jgi:hypothetical protein
LYRETLLMAVNPHLTGNEPAFGVNLLFRRALRSRDRSCEVPLGEAWSDLSEDRFGPVSG